MKNLWSSIKAEFRRENFSLNFERNSQFLQKDPEEVLEYFHSAIWPCCNRFVYLVYRIFIAVYYTIWFVESIVRNAEYRAQNYFMSNKQKTNILHLHPWPFYMTSWSLTLLFIHLWISAFICLYFYSISQKSRLYAIFSYLFGPFSCSKISQSNLTNANARKAKPIFIVRLFNIIFGRKTNPDELNSANNAVSETNTANENRDKQVSETNLNKKQAKLKAKYSNETDASLLGMGCQKPHFDVEINNPEPNEQQEAKSTPKIKETYCDNKSQCYFPSSSVSDIDSWKLWIKSHVPTAILVLIKISWLLYNLIVISAIVVTIGYFTYIYITDMETEPTWLTEIGNLHRHGFNSIVAIVDIVLLAYPVRILHFVYTAIYGWLYAFVTFIYWLQNPSENIIYQEIDYNKPLTILGYYALLTVLTFVMQVFHYFAYKFKLFIRYEYLLVKENCF